MGSPRCSMLLLVNVISFIAVLILSLERAVLIWLSTRDLRGQKNRFGATAASPLVTLGPLNT
jgi:hypothetical protein